MIERGSRIGVAALMAMSLGMASIASAQVPPPETVGDQIPDERIEAAIADLDTLSSTIFAESGIPGLAVVAVWRGEVVFAKGYGERVLGEGAPIDPDTVFQLASLSKPIAATVVARRVGGAGPLSWDSPVAELLPGFALADPWISERVTLGDLFSHRSGLPDHAGDDLEDLGFDPETILERLKLLPLAPFRRQELYTNFGLTAAALAVAKADGRDWASLSEELLYRPLGMSRTSSRYQDYLDQDNHAALHVWDGERFHRSPGRNPDAQSPAGGVSSSALDLAKWMIMVLGEGSFAGERIVEEATLLAATTPQIISRQPSSMRARAGFYGYGFGVSVQPSARVVLSHSGAFYLGTGTNFMLMPSLDLGIAAISNGSPVGAVEAITANFMDLVQFGAPTRDWWPAYHARIAALNAPRIETLVGERPSDPTPASALQNYVGRYANAYFGELIVKEEAGQLALSIGPGPITEPLKHWDGDTFFYEPVNENMPAGSMAAVIFKGDPDMPAESLTIDLYEESGFGRFERLP